MPLDDGRITDDTRIRASLPTIVYLLERGAAVILASHLGRPKGKVNDALRLQAGRRAARASCSAAPVRMTGDALGPGVQVAVDKLRPGDLLLLENLRFHAERGGQRSGVREVAGRAWPTSTSTTPSARRIGRTPRRRGSPTSCRPWRGSCMEREVEPLSRLLRKPARPFHTVIGGAKVRGKLEVLEALLARCQAVLVGGGMANTFLAAQGVSARQEPGRARPAGERQRGSWTRRVASGCA